MSRTKEIGEKILKYSTEKLQERSAKTSEKWSHYVKTLREVNSELNYASALMAIHKKIQFDNQ